MLARLATAFVFALAIAAGPAALAQHTHGPGGHSHDPEKFDPPTTYRQAVEEIDARMHNIDALIKSGALAKVHPQAEVIQAVGKLIGQLALKESSGVPKEAVKDVNVAGKDLAARFDAIDKAADGGDAAGTRKVYDEMVPLLATLRKHAPVLFHCPMKCEGEKTYPAAGKCPTCGMALTDTRAHQDHEAKHGGVFFMAADNFHHLEATLSAEGELRIYFYDDLTRPLTAEKFAAEAKAFPKGAGEDQRKPLTITVAPSKEYLTGKVDPALKFPISVKAYIEFKKGEKPQVFDFDFDAPSRAPKHEEHAHPAKG